MSNKITREVIIWEELPKDWQVKKLKHVSLVQLSNVDKHTVDGQRAVLLCNYVDVYKNEKITSAISFMQATATDEQISRLLIQKNDVLFTKDSETPEDIGVPALVDEDLEGVVCGYHLAMARPDTKLILGNYLLRVLQSEPIKKYFFIKAAGMTRYGLDKQSISEVPIPLPSLKEQQSIANYLDRELSRIDSLISAKERLLELLAEKRRAVITHAVTRGLNGNVSLRDSDVEWLGEIPSHWEVEFARWLFKEIDERSTEHNEEELLSVSHLTGVTSRAEKDVNMFMAESNEGYKICRSGDLVINTLWAWMGAMGIAFQDGIVSPAYNVYRLQEKYIPEYIDLLVRIPIFAQEVIRYSRGVWSSRLRLYPEEFFKVQMPVPPISEQKEIVEHVKSQTEKIDRLSELAKSTIEHLHERRTSLISAVVSGQLQIAG